MMLADSIDATGWTVIIGAVFVGLTQIIAMVLSYMRDRMAAKRHEDNTTAIVEKVDVIKKQTDGMKDELVAAVKDAAFRQGVAAEKAANGEKS